MNPRAMRRSQQRSRRRMRMRRLQRMQKAEAVCEEQGHDYGQWVEAPSGERSSRICGRCGDQEWEVLR